MYDLYDVGFTLHQIYNDCKKTNYIAIIMRESFYVRLQEYLNSCYTNNSPHLAALFGLSIIIDDDVINKFGCYKEAECICVTKEGLDSIIEYIKNRDKGKNKEC